MKAFTLQPEIPLIDCPFSTGLIQVNKNILQEKRVSNLVKRESLFELCLEQTLYHIDGKVIPLEFLLESLMSQSSLIFQSQGGNLANVNPSELPSIQEIFQPTSITNLLIVLKTQSFVDLDDMGFIDWIRQNQYSLMGRIKKEVSESEFERVPNILKFPMFILSGDEAKGCIKHILVHGVYSDKLVKNSDFEIWKCYIKEFLSFGLQVYLTDNGISQDFDLSVQSSSNPFYQTTSLLFNESISNVRWKYMADWHDQILLDDPAYSSSIFTTCTKKSLRSRLFLNQNGEGVSLNEVLDVVFRLLLRTRKHFIDFFNRIQKLMSHYGDSQRRFWSLEVVVARCNEFTVSDYSFKPSFYASLKYNP